MNAGNKKNSSTTLEPEATGAASYETFATCSGDESHSEIAEAFQWTPSPAAHKDGKLGSNRVSSHRLFGPSDPMNLQSPKAGVLAVWILFMILYALMGITFCVIWQK
jgi:hypothetical protein